MGRTARKRNKRKISTESNDMTKVINLQKALKLKCPNIKISYFSDLGWGIRGTKKIDVGEVLIALPLCHLITPDVFCEVFSVLKFETQSAQLALTIFVIYESHLKEKSKYFEYIECLPKSFTNPYFCTNKEINLLPDFVRNEVVAQTSVLKSNFELIHEMINDNTCPHCKKPLKSIFTEEKFCWAWFCVNSRSVFYQDEKHAASMALAPFLDFFNHSNCASTKTYIDFKNRLYVLKSYTRSKKFDQVFIKYGNHSNLKLFLEYGFVLDDFSNDFLEFTFEEVLESVKELNSNFREITKLKYSFIKSNKLNQNLFKNSEFSWNLKALIYVLITKDENLSLLQSKTYSNSFTLSENNAVEKITEILAERKLRELKENFKKMEALENCSPSFRIAKNLTKMYMNLLSQKNQSGSVTEF